MTKINEVINYLESIAPRSLQESYDNSGLIVGDSSTNITNVLVSLDCTEEIVDEAIKRNCNLIVSHHPIVFSGLKQLTGKTYIERVIIKAIENKIALYAIHTNLDNISLGVNNRIGEKLGIVNRKILAPKKGGLKQLSFYCPIKEVDVIRDAIFRAGAGEIGDYDQCSFQINGQGSFKPLKGSAPYIGEEGKLNIMDEVKIEVVLPSHVTSKVVKALLNSHPYEEVAYHLIDLANTNSKVGSGMFGELEKEVSLEDFLQNVKIQMKAEGIRYTKPIQNTVKKIAWCGGSGSFLLPQAKGVDADVFLTADYKYHQFFDAESDLVIVDIGHFESEQYTIDLLVELLNEKFIKFATWFTEISTNPINYL